MKISLISGVTSTAILVAGIAFALLFNPTPLRSASHIQLAEYFTLTIHFLGFATALMGFLRGRRHDWWTNGLCVTAGAGNLIFFGLAILEIFDRGLLHALVLSTNLN